MVEILVVIAIIAVLLTIVVAVSSRAFRTADKTRLGLQLQIVEQGLEAYRTDFASYPITNLNTPASTVNSPKLNESGYRGARALCKALLGPEPQQPYTTAFDATKTDQDGADGLGFRVPPRSGVFSVTTNTAPVSNVKELGGRTYGPYLKANQFKFANTYSPLGTAATAGAKNGDPITATPQPTPDDTAVILDANGNPILYFPLLNAQADVKQQYLMTGPDTDPSTAVTYTPMFRSTDNSAWLPAATFKKTLGDTDGDNKIDATKNEHAAVAGKFILWTPGPDGVYGPNATAKTPGEVDDVTNIQP